MGLYLLRRWAWAETGSEHIEALVTRYWELSVVTKKLCYMVYHWTIIVREVTVTNLLDARYCTTLDSYLGKTARS